LWVCDTEKRFKELKIEYSELVHGVDHTREINGGGKEIDNRDKALIEDIGKRSSV
jgi:hypothetical protein